MDNEATPHSPTSKPLAIVLVEDDVAFQDAFRAAVSVTSDLSVIGVAATVAQARLMLEGPAADVLVVDLGLPDGSGIDVIREAHARWPDCAIMVSTTFADERHVIASIEAGASGYLLKDSSFDELAQAVRQVMAGRVYVSAELSGVMVRELRSLKAGAAPAPAGAALTPREKELVQLFAEGWTTNEIAERLHLSPKTVATHRENVLRKLQARGVADLTRYALREGLSPMHVPMRR
jgi:DNA-binding NarL/FixJ family response regulator